MISGLGRNNDMSLYHYNCNREYDMSLYHYSYNSNYIIVTLAGSKGHSSAE